MRENLVENRQKRALHLRRKEAAVRIASWYKEILTTRRYRYLIDSCRRFKTISTAAFERSRIRARRTCARRILDFMMRETNACQMTIAVQKLRQYTVTIQRCWRSHVATRQAEFTLLMLQLNRFETRLLRYNKRKSVGNRASIFAASVRKTIPLHEEMKTTLSRPLVALRGTEERSGLEYRHRRVKIEDDEGEMTPQQMLFLNTLTVRLPQAIKDRVMRDSRPTRSEFVSQVVSDRLREEMQRFYHKWDNYIADWKIYWAQKPIDDARIRLLASAGILAETRVLEPRRPNLRVLQSTSILASMLEKGLRHLIEESSNSDLRLRDS